MLNAAMCRGQRWLVAVLLLGGLAGSLSCGDGTAPQDAPEDPGERVGPALVSDPVTPVSQVPGLGASVLAPAVAYVSLPPGTYRDGATATITNRRTAAGLTTGLIAGGLDPVAIAADVGDTMAFTIDTGGTEPVRFINTVPEFIRIRVVRTDPPAGKRDVPLNLRIRIVFTEPVDPASVTGTTLGLQQGTTPVSGEVAVSADGLEATFQPAGDLAPETDYTIALGQGIRDTDGSTLESPVTAGFTTGAASGAAVALRFRRQPTNAIAGMKMPSVTLTEVYSDVDTGMASVLPVGVTVTAVDALGKPATGFTGTITVAIGTNAGRGSLSGTTARAAAPSADFDDLRIDEVGRGYTLVATASGLAGATSSSFDVLPATHLIAYRRASNAIEVVKADGTGRALLVSSDFVSGNYVDDPAWAPDGRRLVYETYRHDPETAELSIVALDGTVTNLHQDGYAADWSPDGNRIAFARVRDGNVDIYVMKSNGSDVVRLTTDTTYDFGPVWSPDGERIAFTRSGTIWVMNADGSRRRSLGQDGFGLAWSPDGASIAFTRFVAHPYSSDVYVMRADGSEVRNLTRNPSPARSDDPTWSPDGHRIAFSYNPDPDWNTSVIYVMSADGSGPAPATDIPWSAMRPAWGP